MGGANALSQPLIGSALLELKRTGFAPGRGAQVRVIDDPFLRTEQPHGMTLLLRLYTRDATLAVERGETGHGGNGLILDWRVGELRIRQP